MVNWDSPSVVTVCLEVADKLAVYFSGIYTWHFLITLRYVELPLLMGKLRWRWSYIYYLGARYLVMGTQIPLRQVKEPIAFEIAAITGSLITVFATGNLLFRTVAIWNKNRTAQAILILLGVGHLTLAFTVAIPPIIRSAGDFVPDSSAPKTIGSDTTVPFFLYSFLLDFIIVVMTIYGLFLQRAARSTRLWRSLYRNGLIYYLVTFVINLPTLLFAWIVQSACVIGAFSVPGLVISVMASSHAVISLVVLPDKTDPGRNPRERANIGATAFKSALLTTNINLSMPVPYASPETEEASSSSVPHGNQNDLEGNFQRHDSSTFKGVDGVAYIGK